MRTTNKPAANWLTRTVYLVQVRYKETPIILFLLTKLFVSDIILKVRQPLETEVPKFREESTLISFLYPAQNIELVKKMGERKINAFGKDPHSYYHILQ